MAKENLLRSDRLAELEQIDLGMGAHAKQDRLDRACVMEAVAYVAGEPWSDRPECACSVITAFLRAWNDDIPDDDTRTRLLRPLVPRLVGSRSTAEVEMRRAYLALDWLVRVHLPTWLEVSGLQGQAQKCRELGELNDHVACAVAQPVLETVEYAAGDAARKRIHQAYTHCEIRASAWAAVIATISTVPCKETFIIRDIVWDLMFYVGKIGNVSKVNVQSTVEQLQASALDLIERMLAIQP